MVNTDQRCKEMKERIAALEKALGNNQEVLGLVASLLNGWSQDGSPWSPWDESVRQRVLAAERDNAALAGGKEAKRC